MRPLVAILLLSCSCEAPSVAPTHCMIDAQCPSGMICFPDGCGDPGMGLVVEVTGNTSGLHAQDIDVDSIGGIAASMDLNVRGPLTLSGSLQRNASQPGAPALAYTEGVTITANGKSDLIPGVFRRYQLVLPSGQPGAYQLYVGSGSYTVTARTADTSIPYETQKVVAGPGLLSGASFLFPSMDRRLILTGQVVRSTKPLTTFLSGLTIQAFDHAGGMPLSQTTEVAGLSGNGSFTLYLDQSAVLLSSIALVVAPRDSTVLVPSKTFVIMPVPIAQSSIGVLEMGDFGADLPQVTGALVGTDGGPVVNAAVHFEGKVSGNGTFKSSTVLTDATGAFSIDLLPSQNESPYTMTAIPPPDSNAGILVTLVHAGVVDGGPGFTVGATPKSVFTCPERLTVSGTVTLPNGVPAAHIDVTATAIDAVDMRPLPTLTTTQQTDNEGKYTLLLDPARYRIDYIPVGLVPRKSRIVRIEPDLDSDAGTIITTIDLGDFRLSAGRTINGIVTVRPNTLDPVIPDGGLEDGGTPEFDAGPQPAGMPVPNALVRYYRVTSVEGVASALLVGEAICDEQGHYQLALPDRSAP